MSNQTMSIDSAWQLAVEHHQANRLAEAEHIYRAILQVSPNHYGAQHHIGIIINQLGKHEESLAFFTKALELNPGYAEAHNNMGNALSSLGRLADAEKSYRRAVEILPDYAQAHNNIGNILKELNRHEESEASYRQAIKINPDYVDAIYNLGGYYFSTGQLDKARETLSRVVELKPDFPEAHNNLGSILNTLGERELSEKHLKQAIELSPNYIDAITNLGITIKELGRYDEAETCYRRALEINPDSPIANFCFADLQLKSRGNPSAAFTYYRKAAILEPDNGRFWEGWAGCLSTIEFTAVDEELYQDLTRLLDHPNVTTGIVVPAIVTALHHQPELAAVLAANQAGKDNPDFAADEIAATLSSIHLLLKTISTNPVRDLELEHLLTKTRSGLLLSIKAGGSHDKARDFMTALALHCFANEYLFIVTKRENDALNWLQNRIEQLLENNQEIPTDLLTILGCYMPIYKLNQADKLLEQSWPDEMQVLIKRQLSEPLEEQKLRKQIPVVGSINNQISNNVRNQYEANPYPRWIKPTLYSQAMTISASLRGINIHLEQKPEEKERLDILVAGCGTGQHALLTVSRYKGAQVTAIDLSLSSLAYAVRQTRKLGIENIKYIHADILQVGDLGQQFDLIESSGVIHHMEDPMLGFHNLVAILRPGGFMNIGLYSEMARASVVEAQKFIIKEGYTASADDIRRFRQDFIKSQAGSGSEMEKILKLNDFYSLSECRDLLFHVQEHRFTLPQIANIINELGLKFLGFELRDSRVKHLFKTKFPEQEAMQSLEAWHKFEEIHPDIFMGMYQFWVQKI
ncbi:MAG: tetratricopeptide repeat protein [Magnetococcales bacterium]|nr:tetratricopeptide repeat protein [Magnetococcales bacterium]